MNKNTEYELLTQDLYQSLLNAEGVKTITVQHNVIVRGKAYEHQIDVLWEYEYEGVVRKCAIECKNYSVRLSIGKVRDFYGALLDIGNIDGIMVTKVGYQKGAKEYAQYYGINLKLIREPVDSDWNGRVKVSSTTMTAIGAPVVTDVMVVCDEEWVKANITQGYNDGFKCDVGYHPNEIWIRDRTGEPLKSIIQLAQELPHDGRTGVGLKHLFEWPDGFVQFKDYGLVKIKGIGMTYAVSSGTYHWVTDGSLTAKAILKDVQTGDIKFFLKDGSINPA